MSSGHTETEVERELREKCEAIDTSKTGIISFSELKKAISSLGEDIGESDLREMIDEAKAGVDADESKVQYRILIKAMYAEGEAEEEQ